MAYLTIFTAPKPFTDPHIATIQRNALRSWTSLGDDVAVLLVGDEPGMAVVAAELGITHLPAVDRNRWGTPLISSIFSRAREVSQGPLLAYVNADILLLPDFVSASRRVANLASHFLLVGQRWDLDVQNAIDFSGRWAERLRAEVEARGRLHPAAGSDYFVFRREAFNDIPPFAVGRAGWDNWMIYHACQGDWAVVDATAAVTAIHQDHDYRHLPGNQPHYLLEESDLNRKLAGGKANMYILLDAGHHLVGDEILPVSPSLARAVRRLENRLTPPGVQPGGLRWWLVRRLRRLRRSLTQTEG